MTTLISLTLFFLVIALVARLWARGIAAQPPPTDSEREEWPQ